MSTSVCAKEDGPIKEFASLMEKLCKLFSVTQLAVLATDHDGNPYTSIVAYIASDDLRKILFATSRDTRKYRYLQDNKQVALLVDNRSYCAVDFRDAIAVTVLGRATELAGDDRDKYLDLFAEKLPQLSDFVHLPSTALFSVAVSSFSLVEKFEKVSELLFDL